MEERDYLESFRKQIDRIDEEILFLIKRRIQLSKKIAKYKLTHQLSIENSERESQVMKNLIQRGTSMKISENFTKSLFNTILKQSKEEQQYIFEKNKEE